MNSSLAVIGGFGDFESPSECWGVKLLGVFDDRESAHNFAEIQYQGYREQNWGIGESFKSYFVLVVDGGELAQWGAL